MTVDITWGTAVVSAIATVGAFVVAWVALSAQRRRDQDEMRQAIMGELRGVREGQVRLETLWTERDKTSRDRRDDWLRQAGEQARTICKDLLLEHMANCPGRGGAGGTNPRIQRYDGEVLP